MGVAFHPKDNTLASCSLDKSIKLWNLDTGVELSTMTVDSGPYGVRSVSVSPKGDMIAAGCGNGKIYFMDAQSGEVKRALSGHSHTVSCLAFKPENPKILVSGSWDKTLKIWDLSTAACLSTVTVDAGPFGVLSVSFSPKEDMIAAGCGTGKIYFIDAQSGEVKRALNAHSDWVRAVSWSPCGKWLASGGDDQMVYIWDAQTFEVKCPVTGHSREVSSLAFSADGRWVMSGSKDKTIRLWDIHGVVNRP